MNETLIAPKAETPTGQKALVLSPAFEPQRAPVIEAPENPDVIELTVSDVDWRTASAYLDQRDCLVCTVLRNNGYNVESIGGNAVTVEGVRYRLSPDAGASRHCLPLATSRPFYEPCVVGQVLRLIKHPSVPSV